MSRKTTLLTALLVVVIVGGFMLWSKEESNSLLEDEGTDGSNVTSDDSAYIKTPSTPDTLTKKTTTTGTKPTTPTVASSKVPTPTRVLENGQYISIVTLTNTGFVPQAVTIAKGESVRFVNRSDYAMRIISTVASAEYSGLNQEKSVGFGGTYGLTFPKPGTYAFGNGKASAFIGVVNVQ